MPFVLYVGKAITDGDRDRVKLVEQACKAAWVAIQPESLPCREGDIEGVVGFVPIPSSPIEGTILFAYIYRDNRFEEALERHLQVSLESLYRERGLNVPKVQMIRTNTQCWFDDPASAQVPRKCLDVNDPDYCADGSY